MNFKKAGIIIASSLILCASALSVSAAERNYDANNDGTVNITDATDIQKYLAGQIKNINTDVADVNSDGTISILDSTVLQKILSDNIFSATEPTTEAKETPSQISLNKSSLALGIGEQYTLIVSSDVSDYYKHFSSNDSEVALVSSNGTIEAKSPGTTTITVHTDNGLKSECTVTVGDMAQSVTLNQTSLTLGVGETFDFNSYIPKNTTAYYRWYSSDNSSVAPVEKSGGLVTAKAAGTATITCKLYNGVTADCKVTVKTAPSSVALSASSKTLKVGENFTITESTNSGTYANKFTWSSSNNSVAAIEKGNSNKATIKPKMQGTATIKITTYNGKTATCKVTVKGSKVKCLDVSEWQGNIDFTKVKSAGYDYVIIRAGYGNLKSQIDNKFERNYINAKAAGLKVGVYWYSYAMTPTEAKQEAEACLYVLNGRELDLPVYYDMEYEPAIINLSNSTLTSIATNFCDKIKTAGYKQGVYASSSVFKYSYTINYDKLVSNGYSIWNAEWTSNSTIACDVWQNSETGKVSGIACNVDTNYIYNLNIAG